MINRGSASMAVSTIVRTAKTSLQFSIIVFVEAQ